MACLDENVIAAYLDFRLGPEELHRLFVHVDECADCADLLSKIAAVHAAAGGEPTFDPAAGSADGKPGIAGPAEPATIHGGERGSMTQLGRYSIERTLGVGGMGVVYAGHDPQLDRKVAIKLLRPDVHGDPAIVRARLVREAQAMARLSHPNVISVFEVGSLGEQVFVVMELIDGVTLREWLREKPRDRHEIVRAFVAAGTGLVAAHRAGVIHRDFKPDNVLIARDGRICVTDFGLARFGRGDVEPAAAQANSARPVELTVTRSGQLIGTPAYMAPEQMCGGTTDARSDVFAFCVALYEALYGERPFGSSTMIELQQAIEAGRVLPPPSGARVPPWLRRALLRGIRARPEERWPSLDDLIDILARDRRRTLRIGALVVGSCAVVGLSIALAMASTVRRAGVAVERPAEKLVAVLDLNNRSAAPEAAWLSTAIGELVAAELHAAGGPRVIPDDEVVRMERELGIAPVEEVSSDVLAAVRKDLRADYVVSGSYAALPGDGLRLMLQLRDTASGGVLASAELSGDRHALAELVLTAGAQLRAGLGVVALGARDRDSTRASLPSRPDATLAYARGLYHKRRDDYIEARAAFEEAVRLEPEHAFSHVLLARSLRHLGFEARAREEGRRSFELAGHLEREDQLSIEAYFRELSNDWDRAIELNRALVTFFPHRTDYALRLAGVQTEARRDADCLATIAALRKLPVADPQDPLIDVSEARCADAAGDYRRAQVLTDRAAVEAERRGARLLVATARYYEGNALDELEQLDVALAHEEAAQRIFHAYADRTGEAGVLLVEGNIHLDRREPAAARPLYERAIELYREVGARNGELFALDGLARASAPGQARSLFARAIAIAREVDDRTGLATATMNLALVDVSEGLVQSARRGLDEALAISRRAGNQEREALMQSNLCQLLRRTGDTAAAISACLDADALWRRMGEAGPVRVVVDFYTALVHIDQAQIRDAEAAARRGIARAHALGSPALEAIGEATLAEVLRRRGRLPDAAVAVERARQLWKQAPPTADPQIRVEIEIGAGRVAAAMPDRERARAALVQALNEARANNWGLDLRDAQLALGELDWRAGRRDPSRADLTALADEARTAGDLYIVHEVEAILRR